MQGLFCFRLQELGRQDRYIQDVDGQESFAGKKNRHLLILLKDLLRKSHLEARFELRRLN